jgi:CRISPR-associated protein Cas5h
MISFIIEGMMGQFRKYYTTVTSLTYSFPPRNTVAGIIAAILGLERDSYYDLFSRDKAGIGLQILNPVRKVSFSTNYLDTDQLSYGKFRGESMLPTRVEYVMSLNGGPLRYKVFIEHKDVKFTEALKNKLREQKSHYPLSLGPANCLASLSDFEDMDVEVLHSDGKEEFNIITVISQNQIIKIDPFKNKGKRIMIEERAPPDFKGDRMPASRSMNYIYEADCKSLIVSLKGGVYKIGNEYGTFM